MKRRWGVIQEHTQPTNGLEATEKALGGGGYTLLLVMDRRASCVFRGTVTKSQCEQRVFCQGSQQLGCPHGMGHGVG